MRALSIRGRSVGLLVIIAAILTVGAVSAATIVVVSPTMQRTLNVSPVSNDGDCTNSLFTMPYMYLNNSESWFVPNLGQTIYNDTHVSASSLKVGTTYHYDLWANATDAVRAAIDASRTDPSIQGWVWVIEVAKEGITIGDVSMVYVLNYPIAIAPHAINWAEQTQAGVLVGTGDSAPANVANAAAPPMYVSWGTGANFFERTGMTGWLTFNTPGQYTIRAYLADVSSVGGVGVFHGLTPVITAAAVVSPALS
jgi:hypothetical protein